MYLLDASVPITANNTYYPLDRVPEFWAWLAHMGERGNIKIAQEVFDEVSDGTDDLAAWVKQEDVKDALLLDEAVDVAHLRNVVATGYGTDLTDDELERLGRDPFLIAYAVADLGNRTIVTTEISRPNRKRANRHIPDVCAQFQIQCCNTFELTRALDFRTGWRLSRA